MAILQVRKCRPRGVEAADTLEMESGRSDLGQIHSQAQRNDRKLGLSQPWARDTCCSGIPTNGRGHQGRHHLPWVQHHRLKRSGLPSTGQRTQLGLRREGAKGSGHCLIPTQTNRRSELGHCRRHSQRQHTPILCTLQPTRVVQMTTQLLLPPPPVYPSSAQGSSHSKQMRCRKACAAPPPPNAPPPIPSTRTDPDHPAW
jgi:hypothetical protein